MIKNILKYTVLGGLFVIPFIPFIVSGSMYFPFISGKGFTFRILIEIVFGLYVMLAAIAPEFRPRMSWVSKAVYAFTLVILVADLFGVNVSKSLWSNYERMEGFVLIAHLALYYIVASSVFTKQWWKYFFDTSIFASILISGYSILQLMGRLAINQGGVRVDATFGNASYLAIYLVFHIFLCLYFLSKLYTPTWQKWIYGGAAILETIILYYTATRGAILGFIGGLFIAALLIVLKEKNDIRMRNIAWGVFGVILICAVGFIAIKNTSFVQKSPVLSRFAGLSTSELKTQGRYFVWPMAIKGILERPLLGWGQEGFNFVFNKNYDPRMYGQEQWFDRTHNVVLDWLIAGGIIGFISYVGLYVALLYLIWKKQDSDDMSVVEKSILIGVITAYVFHNMFVFDNLVSYILFFSILGYVHRVKGVSGEADLSSVRPLSQTVSCYVVMPLMAVAIVGAIYTINIPAISANRTLIKAMSSQQAGVSENIQLFKQAFAYHSFGSTEVLEQLFQVATQVILSPQASNQTKVDMYTLVKQEIDNKIKSTPNDARYYVFAGSFFNRMGSQDKGQYDLAIQYLTKGLELSPKKQSIYFELGASYIGKGDYAKAFELFKHAYDLEPASTESKIIYAVGAVYTKNDAVLKDMFSQLDKSVIITDNRFLNAYATIGDIQNVIAILTARVERDPTNLQYKLSLAAAYAQLGQKQKAVDLIREMMTLAPDFKEQGEIYIKQILGTQ